MKKFHHLLDDRKVGVIIIFIGIIVLFYHLIQQNNVDSDSTHVPDKANQPTSYVNNMNLAEINHANDNIQESTIIEDNQIEAFSVY
jgi:hypothetical protein